MDKTIGHGTAPIPSSGPALQQKHSPTQASGPPLQSQMQPSVPTLQTKQSPTHASAFSQPTRQSPTHPSDSAMQTGQTSTQPSGSTLQTRHSPTQASGLTQQTRQSPTHASGSALQTRHSPTQASGSALQTRHSPTQAPSGGFTQMTSQNPSQASGSALQTRHSPTQASGPSEKRRSSVIDQSYMFDTIPLSRPLTHPTPSGKISPADLTHLEAGAEGSSYRTSLMVASKKSVDASHQSKPHADGDKGDGKNPCGYDGVPTKNDLYKESVYTCAHYLGVPSPQRFPTGQEEMCIYAHEIFSEGEKETEEVLEHVNNEPFPLTIVNTKLKQAQGLEGDKANGMIDPYCIVTIETTDSSVVFQLNRREWQHFSTESPLARQKSLQSKHLRPPGETRAQVYENVPDLIKTSVQRQNKSPKWNQRFQCLALRPSVDKLTVEVWDHSNDIKNVAKSIRSYNEVEGQESVDTALKTVHESTMKKKGDIFLGKISIKVAEIPCDGSDRWYNLEGTPNTKDKTPHGRIRLQIWLVHAYRHGRHFTEVAEPKIILGYLWDYVLGAEKKKYGPDADKWDGSIPSAATCLLFQYALQNGISEDSHAIIRWNAYAKHDLGLPGLSGLNTSMKPEPDGTLQPSHIDSQEEIEDSIMKILRDDIIPIIRNHLREPFDLVHNALKSYKDCCEIVQKYDNMPLLEKIQWLVDGALRMCILEWYQHVYTNLVPNHGQVERSDYVRSVVQVMREVNSLIRLGEAKWSPEFWLTGAMEYLPVVYDELQKMVIHDVEAICWLFFQFYHDYKKLRKMLLVNSENDKNFCSSFFDLYKQSQVFVFAQMDIFNDSKHYPFLESYYRWFRPILVLWLGFALIRGSLIICKTINIDNEVQENEHAMTSSSALDTATVFAQLVQFWTTLNWPDIPEAYVVINFLMEVICSYTVLYAELKHYRLEREGYFDPSSRFTISDRLCTVLNNIEHIKEQMQVIPKEIDYDSLIQALEDACGKSEHIVLYEERAQERLVRTSEIVDKHIDQILSNVGLRIQKDISAFIHESFNALIEVNSNKLNDAMEPIIAYLEDNIVVLQKSLHPQNFRKVLQLLWNTVCNGLHDNAINWQMSNTEDQIMLFKRVLQIIPYLQTYFEGGDAGLTMADMNTHHYQDMHHLFNHFSISTEDLILAYYHERAQYHINFKGKTKFGTIRVRLGYWNDKLAVEVISATGLTPHDQELTFFKYFHKKDPTSDAMVELQLRPNSYFSNEKTNTTTVKWKNLNPVFEESFYWPISKEDCQRKSAALVLTTKDYDLLSKNAFLGEAIVPLHVIPGISNSPEPQPMTLMLHEVDKEDHTLLVLASRKWDETAKQFADTQLGRFVQAVAH